MLECVGQNDLGRRLARCKRQRPAAQTAQGDGTCFVFFWGGRERVGNGGREIGPTTIVFDGRHDRSTSGWWNRVPGRQGTSGGHVVV
jgi:hypothetical protein